MYEALATVYLSRAKLLEFVVDSTLPLRVQVRHGWLARRKELSGKDSANLSGGVDPLEGIIFFSKAVQPSFAH
jgi:hypothetical protein